MGPVAEIVTVTVVVSVAYSRVAGGGSEGQRGLSDSRPRIVRAMAFHTVAVVVLRDAEEIRTAERVRDHFDVVGGAHDPDDGAVRRDCARPGTR